QGVPAARIHRVPQAKAPTAPLAKQVASSAPAPGAQTSRPQQTMAAPTPGAQTPRTPQIAVASLDRLSALATAGNPKAEMLVGLKYLDGDGVPVNEAEAVKWLGRSAQHG